MEELEYSEEEIEIEVEEEIEVEVEEEDEELDEDKKKDNRSSTIKRPERRSILIKKKVSSDARKDILLRASLSDKTKSNLTISDKSNKNTPEFKVENYLKNINSKPIQEEINFENINLYEDISEIQKDGNMNFQEFKKGPEKDDDKREENTNIINDNINEVDNNNYNTNKNIQDNKSKEEDEYIEKMAKLMNTNEVVNLLENKKWEDKKLGLIKLNEFIEKSSDINIHLDTYIIYIKYKLNDFKETNFNIIKEGIRCLCSIFSKIKRSDEPNQKYVEIILNGLNEKISDVKLKEIYLELLELLMKSYSEIIVFDTLLKLLENCKKVIVLKEYAEYLDKIIDEKILKVDLNIKGIINFLVNLANNSNPQLRNISSKIICHLYKYLGDDLQLLIKEIKESTLKNIYKEMEKIDEEKLIMFGSKKEIDFNNNKIDNSDKSNIIQNNLNKPADISKLIPPKLLREIDKGKWREKKDGIDYIIKLIDNGNKKILPEGLKDLFDLIQEKLSDANKNFVRIIIQLLSLLILSLGENIKIYSKIFIKPLLLNLSDKNQLLREDCVECINKLIDNQNFEIITNYLPQIIDIENSDMRNEILNLLILNIHSLLNDNYSESFFKELAKALINFLQDKNSKIKSKTESFIIEIKDKIKKDKYLKEIDKYKPSIAEDLKNIIKKLFQENQKQIDKEKERIPIKKYDNAKKENIVKNSSNKNNKTKKADIYTKRKNPITSKNYHKDLLLKDLNTNNKSTIINMTNRSNVLKYKNNSSRNIVKLEKDKKIMNKTVSNWGKPQIKKENSLILNTKKGENDKINAKNRPKLNIYDINLKNNASGLHDSSKTDSNQKSFKTSKEKPIKTEINTDNKLNVNKKNEAIKKMPYNKINPNTIMKKKINKLITSYNSIDDTKTKEGSKQLKKNNNSGKKDNKNEKRFKYIITKKEELMSDLNILLNDDKEITSNISEIYNLIFKNYNNNKDILIKNSDIVFQAFIDLIKKLFSEQKLQIKILKYVSIVLCKISSINELVSSISNQTHINLINLIFFFVNYEEIDSLEEDEEGIIIWKNFNSIMLHIIDYCNFSENIHILLELIKTNVKENRPKLSQYGSRCLAFINQMIKDKYKQIKINEVIKEIHYLLVEYELKRPNLQYNKKEKVIIESITGLINELVRAKKESIIDEYNKEVEIFKNNDKYILNWIKEDLNLIKEEEREIEMKLNIDADIEKLISEELLTV
jgi:hypothetical protein